MTGADGSAGPGTGPGWQWDVALSFAGAQRDYVEQVAQDDWERFIMLLLRAAEEVIRLIDELRRAR